MSPELWPIIYGVCALGGVLVIFMIIAAMRPGDEDDKALHKIWTAIFGPLLKPFTALFGKKEKKNEP